jgi:membrane-associated phospholipid phosphatase
MKAGMIFRSTIAAALIVFAPVTAAAQHAPKRFEYQAQYVLDADQLSVSSVGNSLISARTAAVLIGVAVLFPLDERISRAFRDSTLQQNDFLQHSKDVMNAYGSPGVLVISVAALAGGAIAGSDGLRDAGWHATEAIAVSSVVTTIIKEMAGRVRPNSSPDDPFDFNLAGGLRDRGGRSFPSGHATAAFAFGAAVAEELKVRHPDVARYANPAAYTLATLGALARIYDQKHWPSDVLLGAAIGTFSARIIVKHAHREKTD